MAEDDSSQEKTEQPTPKRRDKARAEGQVPRSRELTTTAVMLAGTLGLMISGELIARKLETIMRHNFSLTRATIFDPASMFAHLGNSLYDALLALLPLFAILLFVAVAGPLALGGWLFSAKSLAPKLSRINPLAGLKRMFSFKSLLELGKALGKVAVVMIVAWALLLVTQQDLLGLSTEGLQRGVLHSLQLSVFAAVVLSASTILIALIDIPLQLHEHSKKLKMSRQEVKDELKDTEGKPEVKGKIRQLQQQMAQQRMMASVPEADVVITNPSHFSVALKYDPASMETPILLAKGVDHMALRIREVARANGVEFVEAPALARAIYHTTDLEQAIPEGLYLAVAQVLAYVFQLREFRRGRSHKPHLPRNFEIPDNMRY